MSQIDIYTKVSIVYRMGGFESANRVHTGPNRQRMSQDMLVTAPLQMHAHTGSHKDDKKCAHVTSQEPPRRNQRIPHPTPPHTRAVGACMASIHPQNKPWSSLEHTLHISTTDATLAVARTATATSDLRFRARFRMLSNSRRADAQNEPWFSSWFHV